MKDDQGGTVWRRQPREAMVDGLPVDIPGAIRQIVLSSSEANLPGVIVTGVDDPEITLDGVVHDFGGYRAVSIFLVNRRTKGELGNRSKDERWIYQPKLIITTADGSPAFVAKDFHAAPTTADDDGETAVNALLYSHAREFATGHGVAVGWEKPAEGVQRTTAVFTDFIPEYEVPLLIAPSTRASGATLDMRALAGAATPEDVVRFLSPLAKSYEDWVAATEKTSLAANIQGEGQLRDAARENIKRCVEGARRIRAGWSCLAEMCMSSRLSASRIA